MSEQTRSVRFIFLALILCAVSAASSARGATLTGTFTPIPQGTNVNLTSEGPLDWVHWGLYTDGSLDRKAGVTPRIPDFTTFKVNAPGPYQYADNYNGYSWSDGTPTRSATHTPTGVWMYGKANGFELQFLADTTPQTLKIYVGTFGAVGKFTATLSGTSLSYSDSSITNIQNGPGGVYTLDVAANTPGQVLNIKYLVDQTFDNAGNVTLQAAALTAPGANNPPAVSISDPADGANFSANANISITADAADTDGMIAKVEFFQGAAKLGESSTSPYSLTWSNATAGNYLLTARASDDGGATRTSAPLEIFVNGDGGALSGSVALPTNSVGGYRVDLTADGAADWAHWGLSSPASFDHKAGVPLPQQISNFTTIGTGTTQGLQDYVTEFSWSDGTPTGSAGPTRTGVFIHGLTNGFRITAPADTSGRTLKVYVGLYGAEGKFQAYLSDHSAPAYTDTSLRSSTYGIDFAVYTLDYRAASSGQTLTVEYTAKTLFYADYGNVSLEAATLSSASLPTNALPTVAITSPTNSATFTALADITITAEAADSDGTVSLVEFFQNDIKLGSVTNNPYTFSWTNANAGNYTLTVKATDNLGATSTSSPVSVTVANPNALPTVTITSPTNNATLTAGANITLQANANDSDGSVAKVEFFAGATLLGTATGSPYSFTWTAVPAGNYSLTAKATDNQGAAATSAVVSITVNAPNVSPSVTITSPTNGAVLIAPATFTVQATASDSDGTVAQVQFFNGTVSLGIDTGSPYSASVNNLAAGPYTLSAVATDNLGATATNSVNIVVDAPPTVSLSSPTNNASFTAGANVALQANANDSDGSLAKVEFLAGATLLGTATGSPYSFTWTAVPAGNYSLTAKATDNQGAAATSAVVSITVNPANVSPSVTITSPTNSATFASPADITITVTASDSDGSISKVEFFEGLTRLGETTNAPYSTVWSNVVSGSYLISAKATDDGGAVATSTSVNITVNNTAAAPVTLLNPLASGNRFGFSFFTESNRTYVVERTTSLSSVNWQTLTNMVGNGNVLSATDAIQAETQQFYRVSAE